MIEIVAVVSTDQEFTGEVTSGDDFSADINGVVLGTSDHRALQYRDASDQHPISAITGLEDEITEALTNFDILEIMQGG